MFQNDRDFEVRVKGRTLVKVRDGGVRVDGKDFHADLKSLNDLIDILSEVVEAAQNAGRPRLVASAGKRCDKPPEAERTSKEDAA